MTSNYYTYGTNLRNKEFFTSTVNTKNGIKRYFSNVDTDIYFGNTKVDEMVEFQYSVEEKKLPIFSYNKFYADLIVPGQRIVQGTFAINFTNGAYMTNLLNSIPDSVYNETTFDAEKFNPGDNKKNSALYSKNFDITICNGNYKASNPTYNATVQTICGVQINNNGVAVSAETGKPILEVFSFIAKDYIDDILDEYKTTDDNIDDNVTNSSTSGGNNNTGSNTGNNGSTDKNNGGSSNNSGNTSTNNTSAGTSYKDISYNITFFASVSGKDSGMITVYPSTKKASIDLYKVSQTCTLEILDSSVYNYLKNKTVNYSKVFTLKHNKTYNRYDIALDNTRPIVRNLYAYHLANPKKDVRVKIKYSATINGKMTQIEETSLSMIFNDYRTR